MRSSRSSAGSVAMFLPCGGFAGSLRGDEIQPHQHTLLVGQVPDDLAERQRQFLDQRRSNHNLLRLDLFRMLINIDHFEVVTARAASLRRAPECSVWRGRIGECCRSRKAAAVMRRIRFARRGRLRTPCVSSRASCLLHTDAFVVSRGRRSSPTSTRSVFDRSPMIFRTGSGSFRTSVGSARIWSPLASCGFFIRSTTSM